ncbi:hypothetical protein [Paenibacillus harenae]|uniref:hypothetical protein n=1 Tax=Paenibacillus harenae TaxID=306543 RepID=UPI00041F7DA3|nr:hypothetical protein [Paenibacillus harenae]
MNRQNTAAVTNGGEGSSLLNAVFGPSAGTLFLNFVADVYLYRVIFASCIGIGLTALLLAPLASRRQERVG